MAAEQSGSLSDYLSLLLLLTAELPTIWTTAYKGKETALTRLQKILRRGSQGGPPDVWSKFADVLDRLPNDVLPHDAPEAQHLLEAMHEGIGRRDEPRGYLSIAWASYFRVAMRVCAVIPREEDQKNILQKTIVPLFAAYVKPSEDNRWWVRQDSMSTCAAAFDQIARFNSGTMRSILEEEWGRLADLVITSIRTSSPEQSEFFRDSQDLVSGKGERLARLNAEIQRHSGNLSFTEHLVQSMSLSILKAALDVLKSRNGINELFSPRMLADT